MNLRMAFAVAAHVEPEILIVDEVLAVGDAEFQRKSLAGMGRVGADGRTVVMVSHDLDAVTKLCPRTLWLDGGKLRMDGPTDEVIDAYLRSTRALAQDVLDLTDDRGRAMLHGVRITDPGGRDNNLLRRDASFNIEVDISLLERCPGFDVAVYVLNQRGVRVFDEAWSDTVEVRPDGPGRFTAWVTVPPMLNVGDYSVGVWIGFGDEELLHAEGAATFSLDGNVRGRPDRIVELNLPWQWRPAQDGPTPTEDGFELSTGRRPTDS